MDTQSVKNLEPDKDLPDPLAGFCISASLPTPDGQEIYSVAWLPHLHGLDLARQEIYSAMGVPQRFLGRDLAGEVLHG